MKRLIPIIIVCILLFVIKNIADSIHTHLKNESIVTDLKIQYQQAEQKNAFLTQQFYYVQQDAFIEKEAREKLGWVKEGEYIVIAPPPHTDSAQTEQQVKIANWKKWWELLF